MDGMTERIRPFPTSATWWTSRGAKGRPSSISGGRTFPRPTSWRGSPSHLGSARWRRQDRPEDRYSKMPVTRVTGIVLANAWPSKTLDTASRGQGYCFKRMPDPP